MKVNFEVLLVVLNHQCVGSTALANVLKTRDFHNIGGHHEGPFDAMPHRRQEYKRWWESDPRKYTYVVTVRNPFDAIITYWLQWGDSNPDKGPITVAFLEEYLYRALHYFPIRGKLWRYAWDPMPGPTWIMRYENLEGDVNRLFHRFGLPLLSPGEFKKRNVNANKPRENMAACFSPEAVAWINHHHAEELSRFGYSIGDLP